MVGNGPTCIELRDLVLINWQKCVCFGTPMRTHSLASKTRFVNVSEWSTDFLGSQTETFPGK